MCALLGDPSSYHYGVTLRQTETHAPDGGSIADYPKGWRFLPVPHNSEVGEILKKNGKVVNAMERLSTFQGAGIKQDASGTEAGFKKIIDDAYYNLVIAPQIKAEEERKAREEQEQKETIATLRMRVQELTKKPISVPIYENNTDVNWSLQKTTSYLPLAVVGIVIAVILLLKRRRA